MKRRAFNATVLAIALAMILRDKVIARVNRSRR